MTLKTIDLLRATMSPDQQVFAWVGWGCFEGGMAIWILYSGSGARRDQRTIARIMVWFNLGAIILAFFSDTILSFVRRGGIHIDNFALNWTMAILVTIVAAANLIAVVGVHQVDPDTRKRVRQEEYQEALEEAEEEAEHKIQLERLKHIKNNASAIAPQIGYQQGQDWKQQAYQRWSPQGQSYTPIPGPSSEPRTDPLQFPDLNPNQASQVGNNGNGQK